MNVLRIKVRPERDVEESDFILDHLWADAGAIGLRHAVMGAHAVANEDHDALAAALWFKTGSGPTQAFLEIGVAQRQFVFQFLDSCLDLSRLRRLEIFC